MSTPHRPSSSPNDPAPPSGPRGPRWLERASALLLLVALAVVVTMVVPSVLRSRNADRTDAASPHATAAASAHVTPPGTTWASDQPPRFDPDDTPRITDIERAFPDGMWPGHASRDRPELRGPAPTRAVAAAPLALRELPDVKAAERSRVPAGASLLMVRERDGWALVVHRGDAGVDTGWVPRREIKIP